MNKKAIFLATILLGAFSPILRSGEIVKRDVYYYGTDSTSSQYVFQGDKRKRGASRDSSYDRFAPRYRPVRSNAGVRYTYFVPFHCAYPVTYRSWGRGAWFYPGGNRTVTRIQVPVRRR